MPQPQLQGLHARLAFAQELRAVPEQRLERFFKMSRMLDLGLEIASFAKPFTRHKRSARRWLARQSNVDIEDGAGTRAAGKPRSRQAGVSAFLVAGRPFQH